MTKDFTFQKYGDMLRALKSTGYEFQTFEDFINNPAKKVVVLRHDVDRRAAHSLPMSKKELEVGAKATYFFRIVPESNKKEVIEQIVVDGHELGYHYEDLGMSKGDYDVAYKNYLKNLEYFRQYYPVTTICMHGSPANRIDNRSIWDKFDYKQDGIIAEPYFDVDFDELFYFTDASRSWNNVKVSVRDKVKTKFDFDIHSADKFIEKLLEGELPDKIMINTHPHNWSNFGPLWFFILFWQGFKNIIKAILIKVRE